MRLAIEGHQDKIHRDGAGTERQGMNWLRKLLGLCEHRWVVIETVRVVEREDGPPTGTKYHLQCSVCGDIKARTV